MVTQLSEARSICDPTIKYDQAKTQQLNASSFGNLAIYDQTNLRFYDTFFSYPPKTSCWIVSYVQHVLKAIMICVESFYKLFHESKFDMKWRQQNLFTLNQWILRNVRVSSFEGSAKRPNLFFIMLVFVTTIPQTYETWIFRITCLLSKKHAYNFKISTYFPIMMIIFNSNVQSHTLILTFLLRGQPTFEASFFTIFYLSDIFIL